MKLNLIFGDTDSEFVKALHQGFHSHPEITARVIDFGKLARSPDIDALYVSHTGAEYVGEGARLPTLYHAQVLKTTSAYREKGFPPFVIAGLAVEKEDMGHPELELRLIIVAVIEAAKSFNSEGRGSIQRIGFDFQWTSIKKLSPSMAAKIICDAYDEAVGR